MIHAFRLPFLRRTLSLTFCPCAPKKKVFRFPLSVFRLAFTSLLLRQKWCKTFTSLLYLLYLLLPLFFRTEKLRKSKRKNFVLVGQSSLCFFVWKNWAKARGKRKAVFFCGRRKAEGRRREGKRQKQRNQGFDCPAYFTIRGGSRKKIEKKIMHRVKTYALT